MSCAATRSRSSSTAAKRRSPTCSRAPARMAGSGSWWTSPVARSGPACCCWRRSPRSTTPSGRGQTSSTSIPTTSCFTSAVHRATIRCSTSGPRTRRSSCPTIRRRSLTRSTTGRSPGCSCPSASRPRRRNNRRRSRAPATGSWRPSATRRPGASPTVTSGSPATRSPSPTRAPCSIQRAWSRRAGRDPYAAEVARRSGEVAPQRRARLRAQRDRLRENGRPLESYRRLTLDRALASLVSSAAVDSSGQNR